MELHDKHHGRRSFLRKAALGGMVSFSIPELIAETFRTEKTAKIKLEKGDRILFQGDSITDARRNRDNTNGNNPAALGEGYAFMAASALLYEHPQKDLTVYNKGISGNKVYQLAGRWEEDCIALAPDVVSILIGVNDFWHTLVNDYQGTAETYRKDLFALLERTRQQLPGVKLIIGEPFALPGSAVNEQWFPAFDAYRNIAREVAADFQAGFVPYQRLFEKALKIAPGAYWSGDGVHPTLAGARLMAQGWLEAVKG